MPLLVGGLVTVILILTMAIKYGSFIIVTKNDLVIIEKKQKDEDKDKCEFRMTHILYIDNCNKFDVGDKLKLSKEY